MKIINSPEIFIGETALEDLKGILDKLNAQKVMVVTDKNIVQIGIYERIKSLLEAANKEIVLCDEVEPDPSIKLVSKIAEEARAKKVDAVIGLGGGSSIDTAKVAAVLVTNDKDVNTYIGIDQVEKDAVPIIAIPTTAGTGSEVTPIAILSDTEEQLKKGVVSSKIIPRYAILDPTLTVGKPPKVTAATGMDAFIHALEAYTSVNASEYSDCLALKAMELISQNLKLAYDDGKNLVAREKMLLGSLLAGMAFANAGVTAVHAFAYPLGGMFHVPHGLANSVMLPIIMEYNTVGNEERFTAVARCITGNPNATAQDGVSYVCQLCEDIAIPKNLQELNIPESAIKQMAEGAMKVTRLLVNNPRKIELEDAISIYTKAYNR